MATRNQGNQGSDKSGKPDDANQADQAAKYTGKRGSSTRGFASMDPQRQREIASEGGQAAHEKGTAHEVDSEEAREPGREGRKPDRRPIS